MKQLIIGLIVLIATLANSAGAKKNSYQIVDTGQQKFYSNSKVIMPPAPGSEYFSHFDKNNDGYITAEEAPKGHP